MNVDVVFLLKFGDKENLLKLQKKGEIYMNTIKTFREFDKAAIGDKYEGTSNIKNISNAKITLEFPEKPLELKSSSLQLREHVTGHIGNIYSTYAISTLLLRRKYSHHIDKRMNLFGSHCLMIKNLKDFTWRVSEKLNSMNIEHSHNLVTYRNFKKNNHVLNPFIKTHLLSYQKEHRFVAYTPSNRPLKFHIGSIEDYTELHTADDLINNLKVSLRQT